MDAGIGVVFQVTPAAPTLLSVVMGMPNQLGYTGDNGAATSAKLSLYGSSGSGSSGIAWDSLGNKYFADSGNNVIRMVTPGGIITTAYGSYYAGACQYDGPSPRLASDAAVRFCSPTNVVFDRFGNIFITDTGNNVVRKVRNVYVPPYALCPTPRNTLGHKAANTP